MTIDQVLTALVNGDTAASLAARLHEPPGCSGRGGAPVRVLPLLNQAREEGRVVRRCMWKGNHVTPARWSHA